MVDTSITTPHKYLMSDVETTQIYKNPGKGCLAGHSKAKPGS
jgi:hypothetical protein